MCTLVEKIGSRPRGILCVDKIGSRLGGILVFAHCLLENRLMIDYQIGTERKGRKHVNISGDPILSTQRIARGRDPDGGDVDFCYGFMYALKIDH